MTDAMPAAERDNPGRAVRPYVSIDPAMRFGRPTVGNTRLSIEAVVCMVWAGESVDEAADEYGVTRADVLVACWYVGTYGSRAWRKRWKTWAEQVHGDLWRASSVDYATIPDPPTGEDNHNG